jgi:hypothetical protein
MSRSNTIPKEGRKNTETSAPKHFLAAQNGNRMTGKLSGSKELPNGFTKSSEWLELDLCQEDLLQGG